MKSEIYENIITEQFIKINELNERIEKAIDYIKATGVHPKQIDSFVLLNILQGSEENENKEN